MSTFSTELKIEPEFAEPYRLWMNDPTPQTSGSMLKALQPAMDRGIRAHVGKNIGVTTRSHARRITLQALRTYDPNRAALQTHVINHLQGLKRVQRQQSHVLKTPERVMLDRGRLEDATVTLEDRIGREPSTLELADFTGLSTKRIEYIRLFRSPVSQSAFSARAGAGGEVSGYSPAVQQESDAWVRAVHMDLNPINQQILEWTLGLYGSSAMSNNAIAKRLKMTPGAVTQRKALIQKQLNRQEEISPF